MIENVPTCTEYAKIRIITNGGIKEYDSIVSHKILIMQVHLNTDLMANILSLKYMAPLPGVNITMDKSKECVITVSLVDGGILKFKECEEGIHHYDNANNNTNK